MRRRGHGSPESLCSFFSWWSIAAFRRCLWGCPSRPGLCFISSWRWWDFSCWGGRFRSWLRRFPCLSSSLSCPTSRAPSWLSQSAAWLTLAVFRTMPLLCAAHALDSPPDRLSNSWGRWFSSPAPLIISQISPLAWYFRSSVPCYSPWGLLRFQWPCFLR